MNIQARPPAATTTTAITHIFGTSDDLIEVEGGLYDELYPVDGGDVLSVTVTTDVGPREVLIGVDYGPDGIWHLTVQTRPDLVTITPARGETELDDVDGCPGYSDKATIVGVTSVHLLSQEGDR
ncbi:conserved hypothetical protein [Xylanimonas cellulosilytica DSM 15894]|uniref:Uncharacterized protein n=1 Tax=Xylanimonas cellulosilytica (strain DSM 15894 / JCM 12276 / CECT 5975 / KCTC 9989 / LMG 20990 / NBRC 107835 / XIL07) TaxID=446471 RepID=D1BWL8_XYLCX|nr:hypothetical protein [Xylanimonas cellulosilytica]ACZ29600.1 conserved hypothetical protein [Xylanimonas cellulosilytica DSM 15894]